MQEAQFRAVENWAALKVAALTMAGKPHTLPFPQPEEMSKGKAERQKSVTRKMKKIGMVFYLL